MSPTLVGGQVGMNQDRLNDVKAAWDAIKGLKLTKLEYQGRRSRAEQFAVWKGFAALQVQSLGYAGVSCWMGLWCKVEEAYRRHLATPYLQRSAVKVTDPEDVPFPQLERRLRPLLVQALPEGLRR